VPVRRRDRRLSPALRAARPALRGPRAGWLRARRAQPAVRHRPAVPLSAQGHAVRRDRQREDPLTLWDTRLQVGFAVRNVTECVRLAATDLKIKTALIDARYVCGDRPLSDEFERALDRDIKPRA